MVTLTEKVKDIAAGGYFTTVLTESGKIYQWGIGTSNAVYEIQFPVSVNITHIVAGG